MPSLETDILDLIAQLPDHLGDVSVTTESKFITLGGVLYACRAEILHLREEVERLQKLERRRK